MNRHRLAPAALALLVSALPLAADGASLTPPNLVTASSLSGPDLLLVWPYAAGGPLEAMSWSTFTAQMQAAIAGAFLARANNLSDLANPTIGRTNLGLGTAATANTGTSGSTVPLLNGANTWSAEQTFPASATGAASINVPPGSAPASPANGDIWATSSGVFARVNGATKQLDSSGVPGGSSGDIQYNNAGAFGGVTPTGSGAVVEATSPTIATPTITGSTSIGNANSNTITLTGHVVGGSGTTPTSPSGCAVAAGSTDFRGTASGSSSASCSISFSRTYSVAPICQVQLSTSGGLYVSSTSTSGFTATLGAGFSAPFTWICIG